MKVAEGQLAALIEGLLSEKQDITNRRDSQSVGASPLCRVERRHAANDWRYRRQGVVATFATRIAQTFAVFFGSYVKTCAKTAHETLRIAKIVAVDKRRRAALAACFFAFFSLFPSQTHSANLSTTP